MSTHTYAILDVSQSVFDEIAAKLKAAGYGHAFDRDVIDMHGIAIRGNGYVPDQSCKVSDEDIRAHFRLSQSIRSIRDQMVDVDVEAFFRP